MNVPLRGVVVCVNYLDLLKITLPLNRKHFESILIITDKNCKDEVVKFAGEMECPTAVTNRFYDHGAKFNKWKALEFALSLFGRRGWMCLMDADIVWPDEACFKEPPKIGELWSPLRRMAPIEYAGEVAKHGHRTEADWKRFGIHRNVNEWAGYTQIFHADDPALGSPPWHQQDWSHAGGADSFFQQKWTPENKKRFDWECLHLGEAGVNWMGRVVPHTDGTVPANAEQLRADVGAIWDRRRRRKEQGLEPFGPEKVHEPYQG